jgi:hypothetical protein
MKLAGSPPCATVAEPTSATAKATGLSLMWTFSRVRLEKAWRPTLRRKEVASSDPRQKRTS